MRVFIIGVSGAIGGLLAQELIDRGDHVSGLVRREQHRRVSDPSPRDDRRRAIGDDLLRRFSALVAVG